MSAGKELPEGWRRRGGWLADLICWLTGREGAMFVRRDGALVVRFGCGAWGGTLMPIADSLCLENLEPTAREAMEALDREYPMEKSDG